MGAPIPFSVAWGSGPVRVLMPDRNYDVLPRPPWSGGPAEALQRAGESLGTWRVDLAGVKVDGPRLIRLATSAKAASLEAALREDFGRPVDLEDFLLFLDDLLREGEQGLEGEVVWITSSRARKAGIFLHPDDIFEGKPRLYGSHGPVVIDPPRPQLNLAPARDGDSPGSAWAMRYPNPVKEPEALAALARIRDESALAQRVRSLIAQLRAQGAEVYLNSTVRSPERGYLMWGAFLLSRAANEEELLAGVKRLERAREEWGLEVQIRWLDPKGWQATRDAALAMAETYEVVFATEAGARASDHYTGNAVDLVALGLPTRLELRAPEGEIRVFDLSDPAEARDLSLSPQIIEWLEAQFGLQKMRSDYPHWSDAR
jgi:hypothetical protein